MPVVSCVSYRPVNAVCRVSENISFFFVHCVHCTITFDYPWQCVSLQRLQDTRLYEISTRHLHCIYVCRNNYLMFHSLCLHKKPSIVFEYNEIDHELENNLTEINTSRVLKQAEKSCNHKSVSHLISLSGLLCAAWSIPETFLDKVEIDVSCKKFLGDETYVKH